MRIQYGFQIKVEYKWSIFNLDNIKSKFHNINSTKRNLSNVLWIFQPVIIIRVKSYTIIVNPWTIKFLHQTAWINPGSDRTDIENHIEITQIKGNFLNPATAFIKWTLVFNYEEILVNGKYLLVVLRLE